RGGGRGLRRAHRPRPVACRTAPPGPGDDGRGGGDARRRYGAGAAPQDRTAVNADTGARAFDELTVFERTATGDAALATPPPGLDRASLRLLTLIDGQRSLAELPRFARAGELDRLVG